MNAQLVHPMLTMPALHNRITHQFPLPSRPTHSSSDYINNPPGTDKDAVQATSWQNTVVNCANQQWL